MKISRVIGTQALSIIQNHLITLVFVCVLLCELQNQVSGIPHPLSCDARDPLYPVLTSGIRATALGTGVFVTKTSFLH